MKLKKLTALMMLGFGFSVAQAAELPNITILATGGDDCRKWRNCRFFCL